MVQVRMRKLSPATLASSTGVSSRRNARQARNRRLRGVGRILSKYL